jgi:hypothetical protein
LGSIFNFSDNFLPRAGLHVVSKVVPPIGTIVQVNCLETALESYLGSIRACSKMYTLLEVSNGNSLASEWIRSYALHPLGNPILTHFTRFPIDVSPTG